MHIGADEAGKGPVLGPMVAAAVRADESALPDGLDDSKKLSVARREQLDSLLREREGVRVATAIVPVERIDDPETDMNSLGVEAQAEAIAAVAEDDDEAVVDAADTSEERFGNRVESALADAGFSVAVTAEHGADETHAIVSAASVVAKVERDRRVEELAQEYGDIGSGYPSDPTTRGFLAEYVDDHGGLPDCARKSWSTCEDLLAAAEQSALGDF